MSICWTTFNSKDISVSLNMNEWHIFKVDFFENYKNVNNSAIFWDISKSLEMQVGTNKVYLSWNFHTGYSKDDRVIVKNLFFGPIFTCDLKKYVIFKISQTLEFCSILGPQQIPRSASNYLKVWLFRCPLKP